MKSIVRKYLFLAAGLALVTFGAHIALLSPMNVKYHVTLADTEAANTKLVDYQRTLYTINDYLQKKRELKSQRDILTAQLFNKKEVLALVKHLESDAQNRDLRVKEITPSVSELLALNALAPGDGAPRYLDIAMRYTGSFKDAGAFLASLEKEAMFVNLLSYNVISRETGLVPAEYRVRFSSIIGGSTDNEAGE
jgi:Tfp pilus assembly protein PilO